MNEKINKEKLEVLENDLANAEYDLSLTWDGMRAYKVHLIKVEIATLEKSIFLQSEYGDALTKLSDKGLLNQADTVRSLLSYYNSAEGESRGLEMINRREVRNQWTTVEKELSNRGLVARSGDYLV